MDSLTQPFNPLKVLSFDLETTSANPFEARIVTSALVHIDSGGAHPQELLADPGVPIPEAATKVHGITTEYARSTAVPTRMCLQKPSPRSEKRGRMGTRSLCITHHTI